MRLSRLRCGSHAALLAGVLALTVLRAPETSAAQVEPSSPAESESRSPVAEAAAPTVVQGPRPPTAGSTTSAAAETSTPLVLGLAAPFPSAALPPGAAALRAADTPASPSGIADTPPGGPEAALHDFLLEVREEVDRQLYEGEFERADVGLEVAMRRVFADADLLPLSPRTADVAFSLGLAWASGAESAALRTQRLGELADLFPVGVGRGTHPPSILEELEEARARSAPLVLMAEEGCTLDVGGLEAGALASLPERLVRVAATCAGRRGPLIPLRASALLGPDIVADGAGGLALSAEAAAPLRALADGAQIPPLPDALRAGHRSVRLAGEADGERLVLHDDGSRLCASRGSDIPWGTLWEHAERCAPLASAPAASHALTELVEGDPLPPAQRSLAAARWSLLVATAAAGVVTTWATFDALALRSDWSACAEQVGCGDTGRFDLYEDLTRRRRRQAVALGATGAALGVTTTLVWRSTRPLRIAPTSAAGATLSGSLPAPVPGPPSGLPPLRSRR